MNSTVKGLITDFVRVGVPVAAILAIIIAIAPQLNVPAQYIAYVSVAAGIVNSLLGFLKPYATKAIFRGSK